MSMDTENRLDWEWKDEDKCIICHEKVAEPWRCELCGEPVCDLCVIYIDLTVLVTVKKEESDYRFCPICMKAMIILNKKEIESIQVRIGGKTWK